MPTFNLTLIKISFVIFPFYPPKTPLLLKYKSTIFNACILFLHQIVFNNVYNLIHWLPRKHIPNFLPYSS